MVRCSQVEVPTNPTDMLVFGAYIPETTLYQYGQPPQTIPAHWSTSDCILTQQYSSGTATFHGLTLLSTYPGEVDLRQSANVASLDVRAGKIKQNDLATIGSGLAGTITVTTGLFWSGGTINSNTVAGDLKLAPGAQGTAAPTNGGTVDLGSTLTLLGGSTLGSLLNMYEGTFNINNGNGFVVEDHSLFRINAPVPKQSDPPTIDGKITINGKPNPPNDQGQVTVLQGAICEIVADDRPANNTLPAKVEFKGEKPRLYNAGSVSIRDRAELRFIPTGKDEDGVDFDGAGGGLIQDTFNIGTPQTVVQAGCGIICQGKTRVAITDGALRLEEERENGQPVAIQDPIRIKAAGDTVALDMGANATLTRDNTIPQVPLTLNISGSTKSIECLGTIELYAEKGQYINDKILASGQVVFGGAAKIGMKWFNNNGSLAPSGDWWTLIESTYSDPNNTAAISGNPTFIYPPLNPPFELLVAGVSSDNKKYQVCPNS
jgi:hypothetical protein